MARIAHAVGIYEFANRWREECLIGDGSLLWEKEAVWTKENLEAFRKCFVEKFDPGEGNFFEKFEKQLKGQSEGLYRLAGEIVLMLCPFSSSITFEKKKERVREILAWKEGLSLDEKKLDSLKTAIGHPGAAYNINMYHEILFIFYLADEIKNKEKPARKKIFSEHKKFRNFLDEEILEKPEIKRAAQGRDILLHLLYPDDYERIASQSQKRQVVEAFDELCEQEDEELDDKLYTIRQKLRKFYENENSILDFYFPPLKVLCPLTRDDFSPLAALKMKKQIIFYGPPGTGKTYEAKKIARALIHQELFKDMGSKKYFDNINEEEVNKYILYVQFHPNYSYEDFIGGLQLREGGKTEYTEGVLLKAIKNKEANKPMVIILDEINRADLSRVLGECFSLLEDREEPIQLAGDGGSIKFPSDLYFIGTMNLIDQSLEQVDFALRRRFLWFFRGFNQEKLSEIAKYKWEIAKDKREKKTGIPSKWTWERVQEEFEQLAEKAQKLNDVISEDKNLGENYQIGHTYFCEVVGFIEALLKENPDSKFIMFGKSGARKETIGALWQYSLQPLLEQYLAGIEIQEKKKFIKDAEKEFKRTN